ncbi:MAG TPA: gamma-glutamyl-gamma-aminobutyrate hydrolase family protein, partial [Terrimesophilobacter sp.]|nr:gamma-glutamyl-gamma-aminobutyrate hydrolase family protein [Terrimesophilobacter sp.]
MTTALTRSALVIQHDPNIHLGNLEPVLRGRGYAITVVDSTVTDVSTLDATAPDVLIVLGGHEAAYELERFPFLKNELRLIRARIDAQRPLLGVCLGAQLMAGAMGARNYRGKKPDYGYRVLTLTDAGESSPLRHARGVPMLEWHGDHFELPEEATLLASS